MKEQAKAWLLEDKVDLILGYIIRDGQILPHYFSKDKIEEIDSLATTPECYPLEKMAAVLIREKPSVRVGIVAGDRTQRGLKVLYLWNQLNPDQIETLEVSGYPSKMKDQSECSNPKPKGGGRYENDRGLDNRMTPEEIEKFEPEDRFKRWMYEFGKCLKCYGCRNICPVCFCRECSLEHPELVGTGDLPPDIPVFHLVRAVHMAGRCIDCGLCEEACPVDIPLRLLYDKVNEIVGRIFDYKPGIDTQPSPFNMLGEEPKIEHKPISGSR